MLEEIAERVARLEENEITVFKRLDEHRDQIKDITRLTIAVEKIASKTENISAKVNAIDDRLNAIERRPAKKWEKAKETIWTAILTGVLGAILGAVLALLFK